MWEFLSCGFSSILWLVTCALIFSLWQNTKLLGKINKLINFKKNHLDPIYNFLGGSGEGIVYVKRLVRLSLFARLMQCFFDPSKTTTYFSFEDSFCHWDEVCQGSLPFLCLQCKPKSELAASQNFFKEICRKTLKIVLSAQFSTSLLSKCNK